MKPTVKNKERRKYTSFPWMILFADIFANVKRACFYTFIRPRILLNETKEIPEFVKFHLCRQWFLLVLCDLNGVPKFIKKDKSISIYLSIYLFIFFLSLAV